MPVLYTGPRFFVGSGVTAEALGVDGDRIVFIGDRSCALSALGPDVAAEHLPGALVVPAFVDAHTHLAEFGGSLSQVDLVAAGSLDGIRGLLRATREADPDAPRLLGRSWLFDAVPGAPDRRMLDADFPDVPVYLTANDLHSVWANSAALAEMGIDDDSPDPIGGEIVRDAAGRATGLLLETAAHVYAWDFLAAQQTEADRDRAMDAALAAYAAAGVGGVVDMMMESRDWATLQRARTRLGELPVRVAAHWAVLRTGDGESELAAVAEAARIAREDSTPDLAVIGIKIVADGVIDACTATMRQPYANGSNAEPIWPLDALVPVVTAADAAGLRVAVHAIGDAASDIALDALAAAVATNGPRTGRAHRIEHLETVAPENVERMARAGVTASMQPVHADPAILANWIAVLGDDRADRGFPWREFEDADVVLAFGTDAPTAPHSALHNLYIAATRASAIDPSVAPVHPGAEVSLDAAITHATADAAAASGWDDTGRLAVGARADFAVLDTDPFRAGPESLLQARVLRTVVGGRVTFET